MVKLLPIENSNLEQLKNWRNDPELMARTREWKMLSDVNQINWFNSLYKDRYPTNLMYGIHAEVEIPDYAYITEDKVRPMKHTFLIGCCGLCYIDYINRSAEISIYIGDNSCRRKGYGLETLLALEEIGFGDMNLRRLWAEIYSFNTPSMLLFERAGYKKEAILKETVYKKDEWHDSHFYTLFNTNES